LPEPAQKDNTTLAVTHIHIKRKYKKLYSHKECIDTVGWVTGRHAVCKKSHTAAVPRFIWNLWGSWPNLE